MVKIKSIFLLFGAGLCFSVSLKAMEEERCHLVKIPSKAPCTRRDYQRSIDDFFDAYEISYDEGMITLMRKRESTILGFKPLKGDHEFMTVFFDNMI